MHLTYGAHPVGQIHASFPNYYGKIIKNKNNRLRETEIKKGKSLRLHCSLPAFPRSRRKYTRLAGLLTYFRS